MELAIVFQMLMSASALVAAITLIVLAYDLRLIRLAVQKLSGRGHKSSQDVRPFHSPAGFAIYVFRNNRWELESDLSAPGCEPSPPTIPGAFEGHVVKKESRPRG